MMATAQTFIFDGERPRAARLEADVHRGLPSFALLGLPDAAVRESRERIRAALVNCGFEFPLRRVVVNLAPASFNKSAPGLDLPIAVALLCASGQLSPNRLKRTALVGGLSLDGSLRPIGGARSIAEAARATGLGAIALPAANRSEAAQVDGIDVLALGSLKQLSALAAGELEPETPSGTAASEGAVGAVAHGSRIPVTKPRTTPSTTQPRACPDCLRRAWLVSLLAPYLERVIGGSPGSRLGDLLRLGSEGLVASAAPGVGLQLLDRVAAISERRFEEELAGAECWAVCRHAGLYPDSLREAADAPWALIGRGDPGLLQGLEPSGAATVVGARRATTYGREAARELGRELAVAGVLVISGLAFGIDACAHRGALEAGGRTIAVLGCGPDVAYPAAHRSLWRRIGESGLLLSEMPPGAAPWRWTFPARNRIMAALGGMTVVVEAAERSGSLITAGLAGGLGRDLGAVPGPIASRSSAGPNNLIVGGARLIRSAQDVLDALRQQG